MKPSEFPLLEVLLKVDLTRAHPCLKKGARGETRVGSGKSAIWRDHATVVFEGGKADGYDIRWKDLEIVDPRWVDYQAGEAAEQAKALAESVASAILVEGLRGGFRRLEVEYGNGRARDVWRVKSEAESVIADLSARGILKRRKGG